MLSGSALALGQFSKSCSSSVIEGSVLTSTCQTTHYPDTKTTSLDLNPFIENVDGTLKWQPGRFNSTCTSTQLSGPSTLSARCHMRDQSLHDTTIDLDDHVANINGTLTYE